MFPSSLFYAFAEMVVPGDIMLLEKAQRMERLMKYALIVVASVPVMILYPFAQRYFVQGVMVGSIKG